MTTPSNAQRIIDLFGGVIATSKATGLDKATVSRWLGTGRRGCHGEIPVRFYPDIYEAAVKKGFPKQAKLFLEGCCPTCGQRVVVK